MSQPEKKEECGPCGGVGLKGKGHKWWHTFLTLSSSGPRGRFYVVRARDIPSVVAEAEQRGFERGIEKAMKEIDLMKDEAEHGKGNGWSILTLINAHSRLSQLKITNE